MVDREFLEGLNNEFSAKLGIEPFPIVLADDWKLRHDGLRKIYLPRTMLDNLDEGEAAFWIALEIVQRNNLFKAHPKLQRVENLAGKWHLHLWVPTLMLAICAVALVVMGIGTQEYEKIGIYLIGGIGVAGVAIAFPFLMGKSTSTNFAANISVSCKANFMDAAQLTGDPAAGERLIRKQCLDRNNRELTEDELRKAEEMYAQMVPAQYQSPEPFDPTSIKSLTETS